MVVRWGSATAYAYDEAGRLAGFAHYLAGDAADGGRLYWIAEPVVFGHDGNEVVEELVYEYPAYPIARRYVHGPGVDEPIVWYEGSGTSDRRFLHADERGSIVAVSDSAGTVTAVNRYDEYGKPAAANTGRFQYTGQAWMPLLGLYDYKARFYWPDGGRFMQTDPSGYSDGPNWYTYVGGDPVNHTDPTGEQSAEFQLEALADQSFLRGMTPEERREYLSKRFNGQVRGLATASTFALPGGLIVRGGALVARAVGMTRLAQATLLHQEPLCFNALI